MQPEPIKSMLTALADAGATQGRVAERQGLNAEIKPVAEQCARTIAGRYPFALGSRSDVLPDDFGQMFGVGGQLDDFFQRKLCRARRHRRHAVGLSAAARRHASRPAARRLADFQRAAKIREAFFRGGGKAPGFKVDLRAARDGPRDQGAGDRRRRTSDEVHAGQHRGSDLHLAECARRVADQAHHGRDAAALRGAVGALSDDRPERSPGVAATRALHGRCSMSTGTRPSSRSYRPAP